MVTYITGRDPTNNLNQKKEESMAKSNFELYSKIKATRNTVKDSLFIIKQSYEDRIDRTDEVKALEDLEKALSAQLRGLKYEQSKLQSRY